MIDTRLMHRLRDQLLERGAPSVAGGSPSSPASAAPYELASLARIAPLAELLFLMLTADADVDEREVLAVRGAVRTLTEGLLSAASVDGLVEGFAAALEREGLEARIADVTARLAADREDAEVGLMLAAAVALADGRVDDRERELFDEVASQLGVSQRRVDELLGR